eukprot:CAMPEP_0116020624 /NCGR_PEP_ID=MMETSP0321-20121206/9907_1 /TAXON_ID=163516 /ORGANISM="Leptocylindrus danicus var. danicus, Strain B650" /LENGTH=104 /DNA_ID=CAMNT_0003491349 /DNA_START=26 /DNA_END=340 /DNA_ORIENTATION=-
MKTFTALLIATFVAATAAFSPSMAKPAFKSALAMSKEVADSEAVRSASPNAAAMAAFATALAPLAASATEIDESVVVGYGAGLVACVVFFAVGFSVGYGTLVKP